MRFIQILTTLTLISLPSYVFRCNDFSWCTSPIPVTLLEIFILGVFLSWFIWRVYTVKIGKTNWQQLFQRLRGPFFWPLLSFSVVATIAMFISPDLRAAAGVWKAYFVEPAMLYLVVLDISLEKKSIHWVIYSLLISGFFTSLLGIWQSVTGVDPFAPSAIKWGRVTAVFDNPNALALYLGPIFLLGLGIIFELIREKKVGKNTYLLTSLVVSLVVILVAIYLSKSRGAGIGIGLSVVFFIFLLFYNYFSEFFKILVRRFVYLVLILLVAIAAILFLNIDNFVPEKAPKPKNSSYSRLCIWQATKGVVSERPLTGVGLSGYPEVYPRFATCENHPFQYPHNIFLNFWVEMGAIGLMVFLWISYRYYSVISKYLQKAIPIALLSALVYLFVHGMVDVPYFKNDLSSEFWVLLSVAAWFENQANK